MRISTATMFEGANRISELQATVNKIQQQVSSDKRVLTPSDDPIASAKALMVTQAQTANQQLAKNRDAATTAMNLEEGTLGSVTLLIQNVQTIIVAANNASLDTEQRQYFGTQLQGIYDELLGMANTQDGTGGYMFAGYNVGTQPFAKTSTGATYTGDQGQRMLQVGESRTMALNDSGSAVFENVSTGNGTFVTSAGATNTGSGVADLGTVTNSLAATGHSYQINFHKVGDDTTYDVVDTTSGTTVSTANAFKNGDSIAFDGIQFNVKGAPAEGDSFAVAPSGKTSIFTTLQTLITTLKNSSTETVSQARLSAGLIQAGGELDSMLDNVLSVRSSIGARLNELDTLSEIGTDRDLLYADQLKKLVGLDMASALSLLAQQTTTLEAAQKSFMAISRLSLFDLM